MKILQIYHHLLLQKNNNCIDRSRSLLVSRHLPQWINYLSFIHSLIPSYFAAYHGRWSRSLSLSVPYNVIVVGFVYAIVHVTSPSFLIAIIAIEYIFTNHTNQSVIMDIAVAIVHSFIHCTIPNRW
jgi:hypothetical protein